MGREARLDPREQLARRERGSTQETYVFETQREGEFDFICSALWERAHMLSLLSGR